MFEKFHPALSLQPDRNKVLLTGPPFNDEASSSSSRTLQMSSSAFHDSPDSPIAKRLVCSKGAFLHRTFQLALKTLDQPIDFEMNASINKIVEMTTGVFERQGVRIGKIRGDL
jgi:hypothetical protein